MAPYTENCYSRVLLFWAKQQAPLYRRLSKNVLREVSAYLATLFMIAVFNRYLNIFTKSRAQHKLEQRFSSGTIFIRTDVETVLCIGGFPPISQAFTLNLSHRGIRDLPEMRVERCLSGAAKAGLYVYVFGSYPGSTACEKFALREERWSDLPNMTTAKYAFSPVLYQQTFYLPDVFRSPQLEVFSLSSETFSILNVQLPVLSGFSVAFLDEDKLVIVACSGRMASWRLGSSESFEVAPCELPSKIAAVSNSPPVRMGKSIFWVQNNTGVLTRFRFPNTVSEIAFYA